jgi:single-stranded-DNA-specific exonuclease
MLNKLLMELLSKRGIKEDETEAFLNPDYQALFDPMLLPNMEKARDRVILSMKQGEHIVVFSDYDADGIPGAVVLADFFRRAMYENVSFYIPHRHDEGFGLNIEAINECGKRGAKLIITVDCGVSDTKEVARANELGMTVVITDHHEPPAILPQAYAIVDPKLEGSIYPFKELCGAAVAYKLVQAVLAKDSFGAKPGMEKWSLDMVGIATLSDMVPLVSENRILARFGLEVLRKSPRTGLAALFKALSMDQKYITEDDIAFMVTPRINAASRMGSPEDAFKLLSSVSPEEAELLASHLEKINNERKGLVASVVKDARKHLALRESLGEVIVVGNPEWRPAILGLVANSLVEEYERPVFVWGRDGDGKLKGSCRSYNGYNLHSLMTAVSDSFLEYGGHAGAGGFSVPEDFSVSLEQVISLEEKLSQALKTLEMKQTEHGDDFVITLELEDVSEDLWHQVALLAPFGVGNEKPLFKLRGEIKSLRQFGKASNHLELVLADRQREIKCISFFSTPDSYRISPDLKSCTVMANLEKSYFRNRPELRFRIVDIIQA